MQRGQALQLGGNPHIALSGTSSGTIGWAIGGLTGSSESIELYRLSLRLEQRGLIGKLLLPDLPVSERDHSDPVPARLNPASRANGPTTEARATTSPALSEPVRRRF